VPRCRRSRVGTLPWREEDGHREGGGDLVGKSEVEEAEAGWAGGRWEGVAGWIWMEGELECC
jgi:hypothetical protein